MTATSSIAWSSGVIVPEGDGRWTEYAGGYSDMLVQRGEDLKREQPASELEERNAEDAERHQSRCRRSKR